MAIIIINETTRIPDQEFRFIFARSGGRGGQNVNKVETKVELLFDIRRSVNLTAGQKEVLMRTAGSRVDGDGVLHIVAQESRSQQANRERAVKKFAEFLRHALKPKKKRIRTRVPAASKERRLEAKRRRSEIKKWRTL